MVAFFALGPAEMLALLLLSSGGNVPDAVSLFPARDYFKMRGIETTQAKMLELAGQEPATAKAQIQQLQALRILAQDRKLDADGLALIQSIAAGKKASDKQGFAQLYAQKALAAMAGKRWTDPVSKDKATDAIAWFPDNAAIVGAVDFRLARIPGAPPAPPEPIIWGFLPEKQKRKILEKVFEMLESSGNVAIHRGAIALCPSDMGFDNPRIYARLSGKYNAAWIMDTVKKLTPVAFAPEKGPNGEKYHLLDLEEDAALALTDDGEFLLAFRPRRGDAKSMVNDMLNVRAGKKDSVLKSKLHRDLIAKVPAGAIGFFAMETPGEANRFLAPSPDIGAPKRVLLSISPALKALDIQAEGVMGTDDNAKAAVKMIFAMREEAIMSLKKMEKVGPGIDSAALIRLLESVQVEGKGRSVHLRLLLPEDVVRSLVDSMMRVLPRDDDPPLPPAKEAPKKGRAA